MSTVMGQHVENECADHAAALGALCFISSQNTNTRWVRPSFGSATLLGACGNMDEFFTRLEKDAHACPTGSVQKLVKCPVPCFPEVLCAPPGPRCSIMLCVWSVDAHVLPSSILSLSGRSWVTMDVSDASSDELWNPMLGLCCHAHVGIFMEALVDEKDLGRIALSCHFALDIFCDKSEVRCAQYHSLEDQCPRESLHRPSPNAQTHSSGDCSGLTLFPSQRIVGR